MSLLPPCRPSRVSLLCLLALVSTASREALAQEAAPQPPQAASAAAPQRIEVTGGRRSDTEERRRSTAAKIIVGREEIERFGDTNLADLMKRLPGVTVDGASGRGASIKMRGLGNGYTQILLDGERVQGGLSLDTLDPSLIERIEILRAPTAETGARAIAGTINIVTREGLRQRLNDVKLSASTSHGRVGGNANWSRDEPVRDGFGYNVSLTGWQVRWDATSVTDTTSPTLQMRERTESLGDHGGLHVGGRLQWKFNDDETLLLMPMARLSRNDVEERSNLDVLQAGPTESPGYASSHSLNDNDSRLVRLNLMWRHLLPLGVRAEWRGGVGESSSRSHTARDEYDDTASLSRQTEDRQQSTERTGQLSGKFSLALPDEQQLVGGVELEAAHRQETLRRWQDGVALPLSGGGDDEASMHRAAVYGQDEWSLNPNWALHAGLRWEGIAVRGQAVDGEVPRNRSSVWTPLLHAVWKPQPKSRDQVRLSLTRSYRSPGLSQLMAQPSWSSRYPVSGPNTATSPDTVGNPDLRPELASGVDLAFEHYLAGGGMLSANVFYRHINDLMRNVTSLQTVSWSPVQRWVSQPVNLGNAVSQGVELEAKAALSEIWDDVPKVDVRVNVSLFRSRVDGVPGPDNRLERQPTGTVNLGADWKLDGWPTTLGASLNLTPGYTTRLTETQWVIQSRRRALDAYALWQLNPWARLRLSGSNLLAEDTTSTTVLGDERAASTSSSRWRLGLALELKL